jgi:hypothetical protein
MKHNRMLATTLLLACCQVSLAQDRVAKLPHSMKGYELYSWTIRGEWYFALLVGTNRLKTRREVSSPKARLRGIEALKNRLGRLPEGEDVTWAGRSAPWTVLPPEKIVDEIKNYCDQRSLTLRVSLRRRVPSRGPGMAVCIVCLGQGVILNEEEYIDLLHLSGQSTHDILNAEIIECQWRRGAGFGWDVYPR